jgi:glutamyl-tRNA synthetase
MTTTRFAPSPTGYLHIGNLRAALFNWLVARRANGTFILRLDDTDPQRSKDEYALAIEEDLTWLGLTWDRIERQSKRLDRYGDAARRLRESGRLYEAFETPGELDLKRKKLLAMGRPPVYDRAALELSEAEKDRLRAERGSHWRFRLDQERIEWTDGILGPLSIDAASVSDPVLIRADGQVLYTFASVVDDSEMGVTDIVRGADHVTNTATQIQIIEALGRRPPRFAHHSLLTGPQGEGLSKRLGTLALRDLRAQGIEPMALLSLLARLGSADPVELRASMDELVDGFDITRFGAAPTKFDVEDLRPLTARYLHAMPYEEISREVADLGVPPDLAPRFWEVARENIETRADLGDWWRIVNGDRAAAVDDADREFVSEALGLLGDPPYDAETWAAWTAAVGEATGRKGKGLFMPLRLAVTGRARGPEMADLMPLLQRKPAA